MTRTSFLASALPVLSAIGLIATACGGNDAQTSDNNIALQDFQKKYDEALCEHLVKCADQPDAATCKRTQAPDPDVAQALASVVYGSLGYDGAAAIACVAAVKGSTCDTPNGLSKSIQDTCDKVFINRHANGGACFTGLECTSGKCKPPMTCADACCEGTCDDVGDAVALDGDCGGMVTKKCQLGTYCDASTSKCAKLKDANEACAQAEACLPGLVCDVGGTGVCFQAAKSDSPCNPMLKVNPCAEYNEYCDAMQSKCVPLPGPGQPAGANCACAADTTCTTGMSGAQVCQLLPIEGEDCGAAGCLGSLKCSDKAMGKCLPFDGAPTCVAPQ